jgi:hypothetical protein
MRDYGQAPPATQIGEVAPVASFVQHAEVTAQPAQGQVVQPNAGR